MDLSHTQAFIRQEKTPSLFSVLEHGIQGDSLNLFVFQQGHDKVSRQAQKEDLDIDPGIQPVGYPARDTGHYEHFEYEFKHDAFQGHGDQKEEYHDHRGGCDIEPADLFVVIAQDLGHGDGLGILLDDDLGHKIDQHDEDQDGEGVDQVHHTSHRPLQLSGNFGQGVIVYDRGDVFFIDVFDLLVRQIT